jgi:RHS repeat-associated protein
VSRDPIGIKGGFNIFQFGENNPQNKIDPKGFSALPSPLPNPLPEPWTPFTDLVGTNGEFLAQYQFDPYGNTISEISNPAISNPFKFSTKYLDAETGLYYYGFRYYQPETGRWAASRDPMGEKGGISLYAFCHNNGANKCDKLGKMPVGSVPPFTLSMDETFYLADSCGHFVWDMMLNVSGPSPLDGYVIQETKIESAFTDCNGNPLGGPDAHYWEAWYFNDSVADDQPVDGWQFSIPGGVSCSKGWILFTGTAAYYAGFDASSWPHDPSSPSGGDPGTVTQDPLLPSPSSGSVHRSLLATWNCCSGTANTQVTKSIY